MSVTICADGAFEDQALELTSYLARPQPEESRDSWVASTFGDVKSTEESEKKEVVAKIVGETKAFGEGTEKEVEGFFNLLLALILSVHPIDSSEFASHYTSILSAVVSDRRRELRRAQYQILSNLHNLLPPSSPLRLPTLSALLSLAQTHSDLPSLAPSLSPSNLSHQISQWPQGQEEKRKFVASVAEAFSSSSTSASSSSAGASSSSSSASASASAYPYYLLQLDFLSSSDSKTIESILSLSLSLPTIFSYTSLLSHPSVKSLSSSSSPVYELVKLFEEGNLSEWKAWESKNGGELEALGLDASALLKKIRYLTLASLGAKAVAKGEGEVSYEEIAEALEVDVKEVEVWVIDAIRLSLLSAKLSQPTQSLRVQKTYIRSFGPSEWQTLQARLAAWDENLAGVAEVVKGACAVGGEGLSVGVGA